MESEFTFKDSCKTGNLRTEHNKVAGGLKEDTRQFLSADRKSSHLRINALPDYSELTVRVKSGVRQPTGMQVVQ